MSASSLGPAVADWSKAGITRARRSGSLSLARNERLLDHSQMLKWLTGEFWLDRYPNGGSVIFGRTLQSTVQIFLIGLWIQQVFDPTRTLSPSWQEACAAFSNNVEWLGAIAAATYAAYYTRFSAQWSYLAGTYNQIKQTEIAARAQDPLLNCNRERRRILAEWKAAFIDDADMLHLAAQKSFASIVIAWARDDLVRESFVDGTYRETEEERLDRVIKRAEAGFKRSRGIRNKQARNVPSPL